MESLAAETVQPYVRGRFGKPYVYEAECESTQLLLLDSGLPEGAAAATEHQTAGRGRLGHPWEAPARSSVLCSVLLHPPPDRHRPELTLVAAIAAAEAVEAELDLAAQIKWPNDVMVNRRKVAGVLGELRNGTVVVGVGINVNQTRKELPADVTTPPASLRTVDGRPHDRAVLLGSLLYRLERLYDGWRHGGLTDLYGELGSRDFLRGRRVSIDGLSGTAVAIHRDGRLEIDAGGERHLVESGRLTYER